MKLLAPLLLLAAVLLAGCAGFHRIPPPAEVRQWFAFPVTRDYPTLASRPRDKTCAGLGPGTPTLRRSSEGKVEHFERRQSPVNGVQFLLFDNLASAGLPYTLNRDGFLRLNNAIAEEWLGHDQRGCVFFTARLKTLSDVGRSRDSTYSSQAVLQFRNAVVIIDLRETGSNHDAPLAALRAVATDMRTLAAAPWAGSS